eukprot:gene3458-3787_t
MKASRAPGPVQSYSILHNKSRQENDIPKSRVRGPPASSTKKVSSNKTTAADSAQGVLKTFIALDDIPDFPQGDASWSFPKTQKQENTVPSSSAARSYGQQQMSYYPPSSRGREEDEEEEEEHGEVEEEEYDERRNGRSDYPVSNSGYPVYSESEHDQIDSDDDEELHTYRSPAKEKTPSSSIPMPTHVPTAASVTGNKKIQSQVSQSRAPNNTNSNRSSSNSNPSKLLMGADGGGQPHKIVLGTSPKGNKLEVNWQAPPLPCEQKTSSSHSSPSPGGEDDKEDPAKKLLYFSKQPRSVEYKPYTLKQYHLIKPKEYVEISKIQPDLNTEELVAKRKNMERIKEFSKQLRVVNQDLIQQQRKLPPATEQIDIEKSKQKLNSKRQKALEFARNIPKPATEKGQQQHGPTGESLTHRDSMGEYLEDEEDDFGGERAWEKTNNSRVSLSAGSSRLPGRVTKKTLRSTSVALDETLAGVADYEVSSRLLELEARHQQSKAQVDAIRKAFGGTHSK